MTEPPPTTAALALHGLPARRQPQVPAAELPGAPTPDSQWYRTAVFYEVMLRCFSDSRGEGSGDIQGLIQRLDYLQWLGIDCLWLPPFYPSPLRDGGYDVADYTAVAAQYGSIADFTELVQQTHARGMRIVV
ncbi:MAG: trehalose synthase, partial [Cellulomonas sp.]|nr:trehalose synthase [Cellulomonas sp.]